MNERRQSPWRVLVRIRRRVRIVVILVLLAVAGYCVPQMIIECIRRPLRYRMIYQRGFQDGIQIQQLAMSGQINPTNINQVVAQRLQSFREWSDTMGHFWP